MPRSNPVFPYHVIDLGQFIQFLLCSFVIRFLFSVFSPNSGKYGPEKTPYLDTFHTVKGSA